LHHEVALHAQREQLPGQRHPDDGLAVAVLGQGQEEQPHDAFSLRSAPGQPAMPGATRPVRTMPSLVPASSKEPPGNSTATAFRPRRTARSKNMPSTGSPASGLLSARPSWSRPANRSPQMAAPQV